MENKHLVAIISYNIHSDHMNYGAALHSYAFQMHLFKHGVKSVIIDYKPEILKYYNIKFPLLNYKRFWHIRSFIRHFMTWGLGLFSNIRKYNKFEKFFDANFVKTDHCYNHEELLNAVDIEGILFDTFVCESDVIWKLYSIGGFNKAFFLTMPAATGKRKVAYSPSLGSRPFTAQEEDEFKSMVADFHAISTRESQGAEYLSKLLKKRIDWVLDPTLLLTDIEYSKIAIKPKETNYLLVYNCMVNDKIMLREAEKFANEHNLVMIEISNYYNNKILMNHIVKTDVGIEEWLGYFQNASFIICNAFHGFCFSIVFRKQVFLFQRDASDFRMKNITDALGLSDRLIAWDNKVIPSEFFNIDYDDVYIKLEEHRKRSFDFIDKYIIQ